MNPYIQARQVRLNEVIATLDTFSDAFHSGGYGRPAVDQNKNLLQEAWSSLNYDAQEATMRMVEAALAKMETEQAEQKRSTGRCSQQSLVRCIPRAYTLIKEMHKNLPHGQAWSTPIARDIFEQALKDVRKVLGSEAYIERSDIYRVWDWIRPSARLAMLDYTYTCIDELLKERAAAERESRRPKVGALQPRIERYEDLSGLSHDKIRYLIVQPGLEDTNPNLGVYHGTPPPFRPLNVAPDRHHQTAATPAQPFRVQERHSLFHNGPVRPVNHFPYDHTDTEFPTQVRKCPDEPLSPDALVARYAGLSSGTRGNSRSVD